MHKYILLFTLLLWLASCSASGGNGSSTSGQSYADQLRQRANGQPGLQTPTTPEPKPTNPPLPPQPQQVIALPTPKVLMGNASAAAPAEAWRDTSRDPDPTDMAVSIAGFAVGITGTPIWLFVFGWIVFSYIVRKKVRK